MVTASSAATRPSSDFYCSSCRHCNGAPFHSSPSEVTRTRTSQWCAECGNHSLAFEACEFYIRYDPDLDFTVGRSTFTPTSPARLSTARFLPMKRA
ncbi:hypothetical protein LshimejAT787_0603310 [Lyophyllum shimeji]|uniref:Uncharacterized protein n=1 Tax=Lyophyllum shimeji TaxID=47721 RepID=A0A9P3PPF5_LYOSH|nr:hypothetical protein LshimejAT787_0603310 [Lyophyllum shimeji]